MNTLLCSIFLVNYDSLNQANRLYTLLSGYGVVDFLTDHY